MRAAPLAAPLLVLALALAPVAAVAADGTPGLRAARLLPGWIAADGSRVTALELTLEPGWKTYWRAPGEAGIAPRFDWQGATDATPHWPAPEVIDSAGTRTLGYHGRLVLPFTLSEEAGAGPAPLTLTVAFGLCDNVCIPAEVTIAAPPPGPAPDPAIEAALAHLPVAGTVLPHCRLTAIEDGIRLSATLPHPQATVDAAAMELAGAPEVWVSAPEITVAGGRVTATADFVPPEGKPFDLDPAGLRLTLIGAAGDQGASETLGCAS